MQKQDPPPVLDASGMFENGSLDRVPKLILEKAPKKKMVTESH